MPLPFLIFSFSIPPVLSVQRQRIVGDAFEGDDQVWIQYSPLTKWIAGEPCEVGKPDCPGLIHPSGAFENTWHESTADTTKDKEETFALIHFPGNGVEVKCILANQLGDTVGTRADYSFFLDGKDTGKRFIHEPQQSKTKFLLDQTAFSTDGLENTNHTLKILLNGGPGPARSSLILLDYFIVSYDDSEQPATDITNIIDRVPETFATQATESQTPSSPSITSTLSLLTSIDGAAIPTRQATSTNTRLSGPADIGSRDPTTNTSNDISTPSTSSDLVSPTSLRALSSTGMSRGVLAGIIVGTLAALLVLVFLIILVRRRRGRHPPLTPSASTLLLEMATTPITKDPGSAIASPPIAVQPHSEQSRRIPEPDGIVEGEGAVANLTETIEHLRVQVQSIHLQQREILDLHRLDRPPGYNQQEQ